MKRTALFILTFAVLISAAAFSGCGNKEATNETSNVQSSVSLESSDELSEQSDLNSANEDESVQSDTVESSAPAQPQESAKETELKFGTKEPIPYDISVKGKTVTIGITSFGNSFIFVSDDAKAESYGGLVGLEETLRDEIINGLTEHLQELSKKETPYAQLPAYASEISESLTSQMNEEWSSKYGVGVKSISIYSFSLSDEDKELLQNMEN